MSMENKATTPQSAQATQFATEATDEIAEIMNEIQSLQQSMAQAQAPRAPAAPAPATPAPAADIGMLEEFHASPGEASMEETLGSMKSEAAGPSLLEETTPAEQETQVKKATASMETHDAEVESLIEAEMAAEAGRAAAQAADARFDASTEAALDALDDVSTDLAQADHASTAPVDEDFAPPVRSSRQPAPAPAAASRPQPAARAAEPAPVAAESSMAASDGTMTMTLTGNMTLRLKYEFGGQEVSVRFGDQFLQLLLADGTEFKIPVGRKALKAA